MKFYAKFLTIFVLAFFAFSEMNCYAAMKFRMPRQGFAKQIGGNAKQKSRVQYDRGNRHYSQEVKPGQTHFIPKDAKNVQINGIPTGAGTRGTTTPQGATRIE